jgi:hypothetical protein
MVPVAGGPYAPAMDLIPPQEQAPPAQVDEELTETEATEIEERLQALGYID